MLLVYSVKIWSMCRQHFRLKKGAIQQQMQEWQKIGGLPADQAISKPMKEAVTAVNTELDRM